MPAPSVDYDAAWSELQELLLRRDGWGTRTILAEMAALRVKHKSKDSASTEAAAGSVAPRADHDVTEVPEEERNEHDSPERPEPDRLRRVS